MCHVQFTFPEVSIGNFKNCILEQQKIINKVLIIQKEFFHPFPNEPDRDLIDFAISASCLSVAGSPLSAVQSKSPVTPPNLLILNFGDLGSLKARGSRCQL